MVRMDTFALTHSAQTSLSSKKLRTIKERILGTRYTLSVSFVGKMRMARLNATYRKKNSATDILAFPLSATSGEILLHAPAIEKKSRSFKLTPQQYLEYVFIHGCLHLKGMDHGRTMEKSEDAWCQRLNVPCPTR